MRLKPTFIWWLFQLQPDVGPITKGAPFRMCIHYTVNSGSRRHVDWMWAIPISTSYDGSNPAEFGYFFSVNICDVLVASSTYIPFEQTACIWNEPFSSSRREGLERLWLKLVTPPLLQIPSPQTFHCWWLSFSHLYFQSLSLVNIRI